MGKKIDKIKHHGRKTWKFFWEDDSIWSWLANVIVAFLLIRFIAYPVLGMLLGTSFPIVAVVSESMQHDLHSGVLCGKEFSQFHDSFDNYWKVCGGWYEAKGVTKEEFKKFPFQNGFYKGDVIVLWRANRNNIDIGDILIFQGNKPQPIIHRIVKVWTEDSTYFYQTKGDHNADSITGTMGETKISEGRIYGKGLFRVPYLGWLKILFVEAVRPFGIVIER
ncbi:MAG: hypothetical protein AB1668_05220 [Nanoarchaeota archaeon]